MPNEPSNIVDRFGDLTHLMTLLKSEKYPFITSVLSTLMETEEKSKQIKIQPHTGRAPSSIANVKNFHDQILLNIQKEIPAIEHVAQASQISPSTVSAIFKELYGKPYYTYFLDFKLGLAKDLLLTGQYSVLQVSQLLGYSHPIKLILPFKKRYNATPGSFKKASKMP